MLVYGYESIGIYRNLHVHELDAKLVLPIKPYVGQIEIIDNGTTPWQPCGGLDEMEMPPYLPQEVVVSHILPRLPVRSLLRYQCVCRAWCEAITRDASFHRAHLRLQTSAPLIAVRNKTNDRRRSYYNIRDATVGFYRLDVCTDKDTAVLLLDHPFSPTNTEEVCVNAHCDGLLLLSAGSIKVRVLNPATGRFLTLPWSTHAVKPAGFPRELAPLGHQALGLGRDHSSNTYKVARFFYRSVVHLGDGGRYRCNPGMEVFTIGGAEHHWRETTAQPLYPVLAGQTATFFKGSLIWTMEEMFHGVPPGFLRFSLEDESFTVMAPPPSWRPNMHSKAAGLTEVRGELWLCGSPEPWNRYGSMDIWISNDLGGNGEWERRYVLHGVPRYLRLICMFDEEIVFQGEPYYHLWIYKQPYGVSKNVISLEDLKFHDPRNDTTVQYPREVVQVCDVIPYVPSLLPL